MKKINHWINGKNVAGADYFHTTNPATGEVLAEVASGGEAEVHQAVAAASISRPPEPQVGSQMRSPDFGAASCANKRETCLGV